MKTWKFFFILLIVLATVEFVFADDALAKRQASDFIARQWHVERVKWNLQIQDSGFKILGLPINTHPYNDFRLFLVLSAKDRGFVVLQVPKNDVYFEVYQDFAKIMPGDTLNFSWREGAKENQYNYPASYLKPSILKNDFNIKI